MTNIDNQNNPVVLFIPEAGIYPYVRGLAVLGDAIKKQGGSVLITRDSGQMFRSPIMAMNRVSANCSEHERKKINNANDRALKAVKNKYDFSILELSEMVDEKLVEEINNLVKVSDDKLEDLKFRNFPVGKIAQHDFILEAKSPYYPGTYDYYRNIYIAYIKNTALALAITDNICSKFKPSLLVTLSDYAQCQSVKYSAKVNDVLKMALVYPVNLGIDTSRFLIQKSVIGYLYYPHCQNWGGAKDLVVMKSSVDACWNDVIFRLFGFGGSHIFSNKKSCDPESIFNNLKLDRNKKTIVAYTSSSDERLGVDILMKELNEGMSIKDAFPDQIAWLSELQNYAAKRNDIQIIVRIHPREGSKQFGFDSVHLKQLKKVFTENTSNFYIVWPDDPMSSYDLMELADLCLVSWSTVGQEAARLGIPVLACAGNMSYPDDDFMQVATSPEEYIMKLDAILKMDYNWYHFLKAVRFYHWRTFIPSLDLGKTVPSDFEDTRIWPEAPEDKIELINDILSDKQNLIEFNINNWKKSITPESEKVESDAMREGIRFFIDKIFYPPKNYSKFIERALYIKGKIWRKYLRRYWCKIINKNYLKKNARENFEDYNLEISNDSSSLNELRLKTIKDKKLRIILSDDLYITLINHGEIIRRMSPMLVKMARLYKESLGIRS